MAIVAHSHPYIVGLDTHARNHVSAIIDTTTAAVLEIRDFPTTAAGTKRSIAWVARRTGFDIAILWVIEGAASYGAVPFATIPAAGYLVVEGAHMNARANLSVGQTDQLDAQRIAAAVLPLETNQLRYTKLNDGVRAALRVLIAARESMTSERTRHVNALTALLRVNSLGLDARRALATAQIVQVARWLGASVARA